MFIDDIALVLIICCSSQSVSTILGDFYPEKNLFQIIFSFTCGPRLAMIALLWVHWKMMDQISLWPTFTAVVGVLRTISAAVSETRW